MFLWQRLNSVTQILTKRKIREVLFLNSKFGVFLCQTDRRITFLRWILEIQG